MLLLSVTNHPFATIAPVLQCSPKQIEIVYQQPKRDRAQRPAEQGGSTLASQCFLFFLYFWCPNIELSFLRP